MVILAESRVDITDLLSAWGGGDGDALGRLLPLVYHELRRVASRRLARERPDHTLQPTALVHEAYLRLAGQSRARWDGRAQFFAIAARLMRRVLVDHARARAATKRGAGRTIVGVDLDAHVPLSRTRVDVLALDAALERLSREDERLARVVELRHFAGLSVVETARALGSSSATVKRDWSLARAWLFKELGGAA